MKPYYHKVQYYETDKMGITHHSNYIRWLEEARVDYLSQIGCGFDVMEKEGICSPVLEVSCRYHKTSTFADIIEITTKITRFNGLRMTVSYEMKNTKDNALICTAESKHCFLNKDFKPFNLRSTPYMEMFQKRVEHDTENK